MRALRLRLVDQTFDQVIQRRADLRFALPLDLKSKLEGRRITSIARRAKYIQAFLDNDTVLILHLGMSGRLLFDGAPGGVHEHLTFGFTDGTKLRFVDPRRFGMLDLCRTDELGTHRWFRALGIEPLAEGFDGAALHKAFLGRISSVKVAMLNQQLVVGIGNIYASEALFRARLSPKRKAGWLGLGRASRLAAAVRTTLECAIEAGGSSLRDYVQSNGELGNFQRQFKVYDRAGQPCSACDEPILKLIQGGRTTFFCRNCQR